MKSLLAIFISLLPIFFPSFSFKPWMRCNSKTRKQAFLDQVLQTLRKHKTENQESCGELKKKLFQKYEENKSRRVCFY